MKVTFNLDSDNVKTLFNNGVQAAISKEIHSLNVTEMANGIVERYVNKKCSSINNTTIAKEVAKELANHGAIKLDDILTFLDKEELKSLIADRVAQHLISKM